MMTEVTYCHTDMLYRSSNATGYINHVQCMGVAYGSCDIVNFT